jgi:hypothetical protein
MPNENRKRAAQAGWARRRGLAEVDAQHIAGASSGIAAPDAPSPDTVSPDTESLFLAYRAAKAKHDAAIAALKQATYGRAPPDPELVRRQALAALEEIEALTAVRALAKPPTKPNAI